MVSPSLATLIASLDGRKGAEPDQRGSPRRAVVNDLDVGQRIEAAGIKDPPMEAETVDRRRPA